MATPSRIEVTSLTATDIAPSLPHRLFMPGNVNVENATSILGGVSREGGDILRVVTWSLLCSSTIPLDGKPTKDEGPEEHEKAAEVLIVAAPWDALG